VFEADDGLPQNVVTAVVQTRDGYLWAGTFTGLARFDGVRFTTFDAIRTPGLNNSRVTSLFEDSQGILWIGHETGDISRRRNGVFEPVEIREEWAGGSIIGIGEDARGEVWFVDALGRLLPVGAGHAIASDKDAGANWGLASMARDDEGQLFLATGAELELINTEGRSVAQFMGLPLVGACQIIARAQDGGIWAVGDGMIRKWHRGTWVASLGPPPWGDEPINALLESRAGTLFVGTVNQGLYALTPGAAPVQLTRSDGLPHVWVRALCEDQEGNIWAGTSGGLVVLRPRKVEVFNPPDAWQGRAVLSTASGRDDVIWVGTEGAGVYQLFQNRWTHHGADSGLSNLYVWSVLEDRRGDLWAGSWGGGLQMLRNGRFAVPVGAEDIPAVVPALAESVNGGLLVGTSAGLLGYADAKVQWLTTKGDPTTSHVRCMAEMPDGSVWFGTPGNGLGQVRDGRVVVYRKADGLPSDFIMCLLVDEEGTLWMGTLDRGLAFRKAGVFGHIGPEAGLPSPLISSLQDDGRGHLWASSQNGLFRVTKQELLDHAAGGRSDVSCISYGEPEGMASVVSTAGFQPSSCRTSDGRMWFPTSKGLAVIDPADVQRNPVPPPVTIEQVLVDDEPGDLKAATVQVEGVGAVPLLVVPPGKQRFEFHYTALSFKAPERVRFKTRLEGLESHWTDPSPRRSVNYSFLPPGRYTFRVIACNNDGVWNETGAAVTLRLLPHFWQTLWFKGTLLLGGGLAIAGGVRFETRRRMRRKLDLIERQEAMERERARIARDIHDDLGASLTRITMLSQTAHEEPTDAAESADYMRQINHTARELTRSMDEIVWAVNPHHDTLESLVNYLGRFAQQYLSPAGIRCRLDLPVRLPAWPLRSEVRHNLFLAFKETLNNTVKHAAAGEVQIRMKLNEGGFTLCVTDDGKGFDTACQQPIGQPGSGNGLRNMRQRMEQIGGTCEIRSTARSGTTVRLMVTIA
jgi:signal transduction histidine kinase/ligand-binding sensor domain-containing protein